MFRSRELSEKPQISLIIMREFLEWLLGSETASSQQIVAVLKAKMEKKRSQQFALLLAVTDDPLLHEASMKQIRQISRAFSAVQTHAVGNAPVAQTSFTRFRENNFFLFS